MSVRNILIKHWGYSSFRPFQEDIITTVMEGNDTLALLPTGGGKSICFQVPGIAMEGICLVITPLIALMKDQVENLRKKGIKAAAIHSGMHRNEIEVAIDNCLYGENKFLYVSPERLVLSNFQEVLQNMNINILAVDEAHCISQWGYDFRPPYLNIADVRKFMPKTPVLALTATATPDVVEDIQEKLKFGRKNVIKSSFERKNLSYVVINEEGKYNQLLKILRNVPGSGIIYVRNRRKTREIRDFLINNNISADYYHAGLKPKERSNKQDSWMQGTKRIMTATNAFGMGIDKPNVRLVIHMDLPDSLEAYFQEAGRGGRDGRQSYAVLIYDKADISVLKNNLNNAFPSLKTIRTIYHALGNYFQLAVGSGRDSSFDFELSDFAKNYNFKPLIVYNALKFLEKQGYLMLTEAFDNPSKVHININKEDLYRFQVENPKYDRFIKLLLRSYSGLFSEFVKINENELASRSSMDKEKVIQILEKLNNYEILTYLTGTDKPRIIFTQERLDKKDLLISKEIYVDRKETAVKRIQSIIDYVTSVNICRSQYLLKYFGEKSSKRCGQCDVCRKRNKIEINDFEFDQIMERVKLILKNKDMTIYDLIREMKEIKAEKIIRIIQWLKDNGSIIEKEGKLHWKQQFTLNF